MTVEKQNTIYKIIATITSIIAISGGLYTGIKTYNQGIVNRAEEKNNANQAPVIKQDLNTHKLEDNEKFAKVIDSIWQVKLGQNIANANIEKVAITVNQMNQDIQWIKFNMRK